MQLEKNACVKKYVLQGFQTIPAREPHAKDMFISLDIDVFPLDGSHPSFPSVFCVLKPDYFQNLFILSTLVSKYVQLRL
jgi:hypothetical protein